MVADARVVSLAVFAGVVCSGRPDIYTRQDDEGEGASV